MSMLVEEWLPLFLRLESVQTVPVSISFVFLGSEEQELRPSPKKRSKRRVVNRFIKVILL